MVKFCVYILYSNSHQRYYIGQTADLTKRLIRHISGYESSTKPYAPWKMVCCILKPSRGEAMVLERKLKNLNTADLTKFITKYGLTDFEGQEA
jgi:putative endonuclease